MEGVGDLRRSSCLCVVRLEMMGCCCCRRRLCRNRSENEVYRRRRTWFLVFFDPRDKEEEEEDKTHGRLKKGYFYFIFYSISAWVQRADMRARKP